MRPLAHLLCYTLVAAASFYAGALTRDYLVSRDAWEARARVKRFYNKPAPELRSLTLDQAPWALSEHRGKVVVLDFWATYCGPCVSAMPMLRQLQQEFGARSDFVLIGVSHDRDADTVRKFCTAQGINWPQLLEPGKMGDNSMANALEIRGIPFTCVIDKAGVIRFFEYSGNPTHCVRALLKDSPPSH